MLWFAFAFVSCLASVAIIETTRRCRLNPYETLMYRNLIAGFLILPLFMYIEWPHQPLFYVAMGLIVLNNAWSNIVMSNLAARKNGRVAMLSQPMVIFLTFVIWLMISPEDLSALETHPGSLAITLACFGVLFTSLFFIRKNDYAWEALLTVIPISVATALLNVVQAWFLTSASGGGIGMILAILLLGTFGTVAVLPLFSRYRVSSPELATARYAEFPIVTMTFLALMGLTSWGAMLQAMEAAPNPAYPVAIGALSPVLFQIYYWIRGWRDHASPMAGAAMTLSALMLGLIHA